MQYTINEIKNKLLDFNRRTAVPNYKASNSNIKKRKELVNLLNKLKNKNELKKSDKQIKKVVSKNSINLNKQLNREIHNLYSISKKITNKRKNKINRILKILKTNNQSKKKKVKLVSKKGKKKMVSKKVKS